MPSEHEKYMRKTVKALRCKQLNKPSSCGGMHKRKQKEEQHHKPMRTAEKCKMKLKCVIV